jgi:hypothetical protein
MSSMSICGGRVKYREGGGGLGRGQNLFFNAILLTNFLEIQEAIKGDTPATPLALAMYGTMSFFWAAEEKNFCWPL